MKRREFLAAAVGGLCAANAGRCSESYVETVTGPVPAGKLGPTLIHEHVLVDFIGADKIDSNRYQPEEVFSVALPFLRKVRGLGCRTLVECTPAYLGRDPALLRRLSAASGMRLLTNTGYYAAGGGKHVPKHAYSENAEDIAGRWTREFRDGIEGSGIRPGFIKIGVEKSPLSAIGRKLAQAAAITHTHTGLTVASHTGDGGAAMEQLEILESEGVPASAFIWVHAQSEKQTDLHLKAAGRGAWVEFDGINNSTVALHVELVKMMIARGLLQQTLISMDAGWYHAGEPRGGNFRGYESLFTIFLPQLRKAGVNESQIRMLLAENPGRALQRGVRPL